MRSNWVGVAAATGQARTDSKIKVVIRIRKGPPKDDFHPPLKLANYVPKETGQMTKSLCGFRVKTRNVECTTPQNRLFDRNLDEKLRAGVA
jgi:hypothetical protein